MPIQPLVHTFPPDVTLQLAATGFRGSWGKKPSKKDRSYYD